MLINFSDQKFYMDKNSIFLAGPTKRNSPFELSWRNEACKYLESIGYDGTVYVPEFSYADTPFNLVPQASWEKKGLMNAGALVFYMCRRFPEEPGLTTNAEFGRYLALRPDNFLLCCPEWANKNSYFEWQFKEDRPNDPIYRDLESILSAAVTMAHKNAKA